MNTNRVLAGSCIGRHDMTADTNTSRKEEVYENIGIARQYRTTLAGNRARLRKIGKFWITKTKAVPIVALDCAPSKTIYATNTAKKLS